MPFGTRAAATHWQDWVNLGMGGWLFISPWVLGFTGQPGPAWNCWALGVLVAAVSVSALIQFVRWEEWLNAAIGLWLLASPWLLGFADSDAASALWNHVASGVVIGVLALWDGLTHGDQRVLIDDY